MVTSLLDTNMEGSLFYPNRTASNFALENSVSSDKQRTLTSYHVKTFFHLRKIMSGSPAFLFIHFSNVCIKCDENDLFML